MEFMKISTVIIIGVIMLVDWLSTLAKKWDTLKKGEMFCSFVVEPFCLIGLVLIAMDLWG